MPPPPPLPPRLLRSDLRRCRCIYCTQLASTCLRTAPCLFFTTLRLRGTPHIRSGSRPAKQHGGSSAACMLPVRPQPCWQSDRHRASPRPLSIHLMQVPAAAACCKTRRTRSTPHPCPFRRPPSRSRLLRGWACGGGGGLMVQDANLASLDCAAHGEHRTTQHSSPGTGAQVPLPVNETAEGEPEEASMSAAAAAAINQFGDAIFEALASEVCGYWCGITACGLSVGCCCHQPVGRGALQGLCVWGALL